MNGLDDLLDFWFDHEEIWFGATREDDILVTERFHDLLINSHHMTLESNIRNRLGLAILWDQIPRHIYRGRRSVIDFYHRKTLMLCLGMIEDGSIEELGPKERVFIMLPLRHTFEIGMVERVIVLVKEYREKERSSYYDRFLKQSLKSYSELLVPTIGPSKEVDPSITNEEIFQHLDKTSVRNLEKVVDLKKRDPFYQVFLNTFRKHGVTKITLSLSGGVDSMVSSFVLHHLLRYGELEEVNCVMINYNNRDECKLETEFVTRWCLLLGLPLYIRHIKHLRRDRDSSKDKSRDRNMYEKVTRKFRFDMYKKFGNPVLLGHNLDDGFENVVTNVTKLINLGNLRGMRDKGQEDTVMTVRSMLGVPKEDIRRFADAHLVPHLVDSTPKWSDRGRIRDELKPAMDRFNPNLVKNLMVVVDHFAQLHQFCNAMIKDFFGKAAIEEKTISIPISEREMDFGMIFWKGILMEVTERFGIGTVSNSSMGELCRRMEKRSYGKMTFNKKLYCDYRKDTILFIYNI